MTDRSATSAASETGPTIWLLVGEKRGDNAQVRNLARHVGGTVVEKSIVVRDAWRERKPPVTASLDHIDAGASDPLEPPWPDLVLTAGRRLASVALHVKSASGGQTRLVVVGKPRGRRDDFDLIVVAAHYVLPEAANVARHAYPLMALDPRSIDRARATWSSRFASLPRPLRAVLVGGPTGGLRFGAEETAALVRDARRFVADEGGGSLYFATSRRTPEAVVNALRRALRSDRNEVLAEYAPAMTGDQNPYPGLLALADHFLVTTDSLSMMVEAAQREQRLSLFALGRKASPAERLLEGLGLMAAQDPTRDAIPAGGVIARTFAALGRPIHSRDLTAIARRLVADGYATWSDQPTRASAPFADPSLGSIAARIRGGPDAGR